MIRRIVQPVSVMIGVILVIFGLFVLLPSPAQLALGQKSDKQTLENINREMGLDKPKSTQLLLYLNDLSPLSIYPDDSASRMTYHYLKLAHLSSGKIFVLKWPYLRRSYQSQRPVSEILLDALPNTAVLAGASFLLAAFLGILLGVIASLKRHSWKESAILIMSILGVSVPSFFVAILLSWGIGFELHPWLHLPMYGSLFGYDVFQGKYLALQNLILPAIALGIRPLAIITQLTRSSMLEVMSQDFIRTARAKGLSPGKVVRRHALPNALNPVVTALSGWLASLLAGAFFVEYIFDWQGLGKVTVDALAASDFPVVMGAVLLISLIFIAMNIATDILYSVLDPRVRN